jgi:hypothetical protein
MTTHNVTPQLSKISLLPLFLTYLISNVFSLFWNFHYPSIVLIRMNVQITTFISLNICSTFRHCYSSNFPLYCACTFIALQTVYSRFILLLLHVLFSRLEDAKPNSLIQDTLPVQILQWTNTKSISEILYLFLDLRFPERWRLKSTPSGLWRRVVLW